MKYTPKTEAQLAEEALLPDGFYDFEIIDAEDKFSKKGSDMIFLKLLVFESDGSQRHIYDYIVLGSTFGERKLRHAANACGLLDIYGTGNIVAGDFLGKSGKILVKKQGGTADYPLAKNIVGDYLPREEGAEPARAPQKTSDIIDDDIPF